MRKQIGFFKSVAALSEYRLEIEMATGTHIVCDFTSRLDTARFSAIKDEKLFKTVRTDGHSIIFLDKSKASETRIGSEEFMDLVLVDRTCEFPGYGV